MSRGQEWVFLSPSLPLPVLPWEKRSPSSRQGKEIDPAGRWGVWWAMGNENRDGGWVGTRCTGDRSGIGLWLLLLLLFAIRGHLLIIEEVFLLLRILVGTVEVGQQTECDHRADGRTKDDNRKVCEIGKKTIKHLFPPPAVIILYPDRG